MSTTDHKHTVTTQTASTIAIDTRINHASISEAVQQAIADTTKPSEAAILADSTLPKVDIPGINRGGLHFQDSSTADPSNGGGHTDPLSSLAASLTAARARLDAMDPTNQQNPTQNGGLHDDWIHNGLPSAADLAAMLGISHEGNFSDPRDSRGKGSGDASTSGSTSSGSGGNSGSAGFSRPDPGGTDPAGTHDPNHNRLEGMLSDDNVKHDAWDYTDKKTGDKHHTEYWIDSKGNYANYDKDLKTGVVHQEVLHPNGSGTEQTTDPHKGTVTTTTTSTDGTQTTTVVDTKVWPQGPVTISQTKPGDPPLEPIDNNSGGKSTGGGNKMPDEDHQNALPEPLQHQVNQMLGDAIKSMHIPSHDGDNVNVANSDIPGTVSRDDVTGVKIDGTHSQLGGDTFNNEGNGEGGLGGSGSVNYNGIAGATDPGPNDDQPVQTSGRDEPNHQQNIHTDPTAHGNGNQTGGQGTGATADHSPAGLIETAAQQAAHKLQDAVGQGHDDPWGTQGRYEQAMSAPASPAETPAQKAADLLQDALGQHDGPSQHEPIKPHEKVPGPDLGQGPGHSGNAHVDAASGFADLIRAAQNPKEFGLATAAHLAAPDATLHLAVNADFAGHGLGPHGVEDAHVAASVPVAVHDIPLDHHSVAAPVVDHIALAHH